MHEYGLMEDIVADAVEEARRRGTPSIHRVRVEVGELSAASPESLAAAFLALAPGTVLEEAHLDLAVIPGELGCTACGLHGSPHDTGLDPEPPWICPTCGFPMAATKGKDIVLADVS